MVGKEKHMKKIKLNVRPASPNDVMFHDGQSGVTSVMIRKKRTKPVPRAPADHPVYTEDHIRVKAPIPKRPKPDQSSE